MAIVTITKDPVDPHKSTRCINLDRKISIRDCANEMLGNWESEPWFCVIVRDGDIYYPLRKEWDEEIRSDDRVHFLPYVGDFGISLILAIIIIILVVAVLFLTMPSPSDPPESGDPVFSIDGKSNKARLGQPIEDAFGRNKIWCSYAGRPFVEYFSDNRQRLYQWFTLGHGRFFISDYLIGDTSITKNPKEPAINTGSVTLPNDEFFVDVDNSITGQSGFNNVTTCEQVQGIELLGTNQDFGNEWVGPFSLNPPNTEVQYIANDFSLPNGCYSVDDEGDTRSVGIHVRWEIRAIDNAGKPVTGTWYNLLEVNRSYATAQPIRTTYKRNAPFPARWEIRCKRLDNAYTDTNGTDICYWDGAKGYRGNITPRKWSTTDDEGMWDFHVRTIASQNTQKNKFQVLATRLQHVRTYQFNVNGTWTINYGRNPIWAMVEILRRPWGANLRDDQIDLEAMYIAAEQADAAGETFDWVFNQSMTVWEAIKVCCSVCRCTPIMNGGLVSVVRDVPQYVPVALFNSENIHQNSFKIQRRVFNNEAHDGLKATYLDQVTWQNETVLATLDTQLGYNPKTINLRGVSDRDQAQKMANYLWASEHYNREIVKFKTTYSAISLTYGDLIKVSTDIADWGQSGQIEQIELGRIFTSSEPFVFTDFVDHNITFRDKLGGVYGPFLVVPYASNPPVYEDIYKCELAAVGAVDETKIPVNDDVLKPQYIFGEVNKDGTICKINKISNQGIDEIEIEAVVENYGRFQFDGDTAPPITYPDLEPVPVPPNVTGLRIVSWNPLNRQIIVEWDASTNPTASSYLTEYGYDGVNWISAGSSSSTTKAFLLPAEVDYLTIPILISVTGLNAEGYGDRTVISERVDTPDLLVDDETPYNELEIANTNGIPIKLKS